MQNSREAIAAETRGRSALVTGSSKGIGSAIAQVLAASGCNVCINYNSLGSKSEAERLASSIASDHGVKTLCVCADVSQSHEAERLIAESLEAFGSVDILVNNAGITKDGLLARMKEEDFDRVLEINLKGAFNCCKAVSGSMMKRRFGRIINMGSIVGVTGNAGQVNYAASKAGLIGLSKSLAKELAPRNITVNVVAPGFIETDMTRALNEKQQEAIRDRIASKRFGSAEEVAALVDFLAGDNASYITGQVIGIDGGMS